MIRTHADPLKNYLDFCDWSSALDLSARAAHA